MPTPVPSSGVLSNLHNSRYCDCQSCIHRISVNTALTSPICLPHGSAPVLSSIHLIITILIFHFLGHTIPGIDRADRGDRNVALLVFNTFLFAQALNLINCRRLNNRLNIFDGIFKNRYFIMITLINMPPGLAFLNTFDLMMVCRNWRSGPY